MTQESQFYEIYIHIKRWAAEDPDRVALIWEKDEPGEAESVTYGQLLEMVGRKGALLGILQLMIQVCRLANVLSDAGVVSGDVVALYMPISPLAVATMLATSRLGAVHNVVFAGILTYPARKFNV